jgi:16S rRNA processing protein RimM
MGMITIGRITKTYGFEGAVVVRSEGGITVEPQQGEPVFVITDGIPVPFFVREVLSTLPDSIIISFDDYLSAESVACLKGCEVMISGEAEHEDELAALEGYDLRDRNSGFTGTIVSVISNPGQLLAVVISHGREIFVPLHPDLIITIDRKNKVIIMSLPVGLTNLKD